MRINDQLLSHLDWIIVGGESGPNARKMHPDWVRSLRGQCGLTGFFFKQWGGRTPQSNGRILDGRTWDEIGSCVPLIGSLVPF
ncbi:hypothetical protein CCP3SC15_4330001 [Gammaproteobacteria bacterium]